MKAYDEGGNMVCSECGSYLRQDNLCYERTPVEGGGYTIIEREYTIYSSIEYGELPGSPVTDWYCPLGH